MRIAIAGFQHETNTFAPNRTGLAEFQMADSWPGLLLGDDVITATSGLNLPIAGAVAEAGNSNLLPILWCAAEPGGPVTDEAFESICNRILAGIRDAQPLDGIYLDLHGAMVTESYDDGEGELLRRIRDLIGPELPLAVSLDLHANVSAAMVELATVMAVFRTYPHLDMADTGARCFQYLQRIIAGEEVSKTLRQATFLVPLHAQYTGKQPANRLYQQVAAFDRHNGCHAELSMGFTAADVADCGPSLVVYAGSEAEADTIADQLIETVTAAREDFDTTLLDSLTAVRAALGSTAGQPVVIADVQDNPGAGGTADTTGLLHALLEAEVSNAVLGVLCDAEVAAQAHRAGIDGQFSACLGAKSGIAGDLPCCADFRVLAVSDGSIPYQGKMYAGGVAEVGPSCLLEVRHARAQLRVVVSSLRIQCLDQAFFRHFDVNLEDARIIVVKSTVHHRADFETLTDQFISAAAPGAFVCELAKLEYKNLRPGMDFL